MAEPYSDFLKFNKTEKNEYQNYRYSIAKFNLC